MVRINKKRNVTEEEKKAVREQYYKNKRYLREEMNA